MSPEETAVTLRLMKRLSGELGLTILFCEHDMGLVFSVANRIMVMQHGCSIVEDTPEAVRSNPQVREAYLGSADVC
jgi:branched-chain amino acid transport system ATP-binding protein